MLPHMTRPSPTVPPCVVGDAPDEAWERHSCGDGAPKAPRLCDWAAARLSAIELLDTCLPRPTPRFGPAIHA